MSEVVQCMSEGAVMPGRTCAPAGETDEQLARRLQAEYDAQPAASPARPAAAAPAQQASPAGPLESGAAVCPIFPACFFFFFFFFFFKAPGVELVPDPSRPSQSPAVAAAVRHTRCGVCQEMCVWRSPRASSALPVPANGALQHAARVHPRTGARRSAGSERARQDLARERPAALCAGALPDGQPRERRRAGAAVRAHGRHGRHGQPVLPGGRRRDGQRAAGAVRQRGRRARERGAQLGAAGAAHVAAQPGAHPARRRRAWGASSLSVAWLESTARRSVRRLQLSQVPMFSCARPGRPLTDTISEQQFSVEVL